MIRRLPSISTTGSVGPSSTRKYGTRSSSRAALQLLEALVLAGLGEDVD